MRRCSKTNWQRERTVIGHAGSQQDGEASVGVRSLDGQQASLGDSGIWSSTVSDQAPLRTVQAPVEEAPALNDS
jgi:hypothetical protein